MHKWREIRPGELSAIADGTLVADVYPCPATKSYRWIVFGRAAGSAGTLEEARAAAEQILTGQEL